MDSSDLNKHTMTYDMENATDTIIPVADAINIGMKLAEEKERRNNHKSAGIKALFKPSPDCGCMVFKIEYPEPEKFQGCNHPKTKNRNDINREQHLKILSSPNPARLRKPLYPKWVEKPIYCATYRLAAIAQPRKLHVQRTWEDHADVLDAYHIDNCRKHLQELRFPKIKEALQYFTQTQRYESARRKERRQHIRTIGKEIRKLRRLKRLQELQFVLDDTYGRMRTFLLADNVHMLNHRVMQISAVVLQVICTFIGYSLPKRKSQAFFDRFLINIADNVALWLHSFVTNCGATTIELLSKFDDEDIVKQDDNEMIPIDDYIECSTDDMSSVESSHSHVSLKSTNDDSKEEDLLERSSSTDDRDEFPFYS